jgi:hypothetical protein
MTNTVCLEPESQMFILKCVLNIRHVLVVQLCYHKSPQKMLLSFTAARVREFGVTLSGGKQTFITVSHNDVL